MSTVRIAPHLWAALEVMGRDMAVEPSALVNQAVFAWLRINGYSTPGTVAALTAAPVAAPAPFTVGPTPPPVANPVAPVTTPTESPLDRALRRMKDIDAALATLTHPLPAWVAVAEEDDEDEDEDEASAPEEEEDRPEEPEASAADSDEEAPEEDEPSEAGAPDEADGEATDEDRAPAVAAAEAAPSQDNQVPEEEDAPQDDHDEVATGEPNSGNTVAMRRPGPPEPEDEPPTEGTFVLKAAPVVLVIEREGEEPIRVEQERFIIGRGPQCDLVIDSPRVSREHVVLTRHGVTYLLEDLGSSNGTWFGEERITVRELEDGDLIVLGNEPLTFSLVAGA